MKTNSSIGGVSNTWRAATLLVVGAALVGCYEKTPEQYLAGAKADLAKKDAAAAVIQLKNALQENPSLAEGRLLLGEALLQGGDFSGAVTELTKARELGIKNDKLASLMAQALLGQGQFAKVITEFGQAQPADPAAKADVQASLAVAYSATSNTAKALEMADAAVGGDAENLRARLIRVRLVAASSGPDGGLQAVEPVLAKWPQSADAWQIKGDLLNVQGKADDALIAYRKAIALNKNHALAHVGAFHALLAKKDLEGAKAEIDALRGARGAAAQVQLLTALLALERNDLDVARDQAQALLKLAPDDVRVLHLAGVVAFRRGALLEAEEYLNKTLQASPGFDKARVLLAQTELRAGDPAKALAALQPLVTAEGKDATALSVAAEAYLQMGDLQRAEAALNRVAKINPNDTPSRAALALVDISKGRVEPGIAALKALSASDPGPVADMALVTTYMQRKDWAQALATVDVLDRKLPKDAGPKNLRGRLELARGNRDKAIQAFEAALQVDANYYPAAASLGALDVEAGKPQAAIDRFQKMVAADPRNLAANMALIGLREQTGTSQQEIVASLEKLIKQMPSEPRPRLALIELQLRRHQVPAALAAATEAAAMLPGNPNVLRHLAGAQAMSGDYNQAVSTYNKLIALQPNSPEPLMLLARIYAARGDRVASKQAMERALKLEPAYRPAQSALIANELAAGNFPEANRLANSMKSLFPNDPLTYSILGDAAAVQRDWTGAVQNYRAALKLLPQVDVAIKLHRVLIGAGKPAEAKQFETEWLSTHPKDLKFLIYSADATLLMLNYDLARERYLSVLKLQPDNANASNNVAWLYNRAKDPKALAYAEKATKLAPENTDFMDTLAQVHATAGRLQKAIEIQKKAVDLSPEKADHRLHLAQFYAAAGQKAEAREQLLQLSQLGSSFAHQAEVKQLLNSL